MGLLHTSRKVGISSTKKHRADSNPNGRCTQVVYNGIYVALQHIYIGTPLRRKKYIILGAWTLRAFILHPQCDTEPSPTKLRTLSRKICKDLGCNKFPALGLTPNINPFVGGGGGGGDLHSLYQEVRSESPHKRGSVGFKPKYIEAEAQNRI